MDERLMPWLAVGAGLILVVILTRGGGRAATGTIIQTGGDYSQRVDAARVFTDLQLGLRGFETERELGLANIEATRQTQQLQIQAARDLGFEGFAVQRELGLASTAAQLSQARAQAQAAAASAREATARRQAELDQQTRSAQIQQQGNIVQGFLSIVGTVIAGLFGLSSDVAYSDMTRAAGLAPTSRGTQWELVNPARTIANSGWRGSR